MNIKRYIGVLHIACLMLVTAGCGGGGGGGGGSNPAAPAGGGGGGGGGGAISTINQANAIVYAAGVLYLGDLLGIGDIVDFATSVETEEKDKPGRFNLAEFVDWQIDMLVNHTYEITPTSVVAVFPVPKNEDCGDPITDGTVGIVWNDNDTDGVLSDGDSAVVTFTGCRGALFGDDAVTGTVDIDVSSVSDSFPAIPAFLSANINISNLQLSWDTGGENVDAALTINAGRTGVAATSLGILGSLSGAGSESGNTYSYSYTNLNLLRTKNGAEYSVLVQGDVVDSDLGEFNINTSDAFTGNDNDVPDNPKAGSATVAALDASNVTINVLDNVDVELQVDGNGDFIAESIFNVTWDQLNSI